jgi:hypothetical protein
MATSFLQYCTTCEKQIVTPSSFVLYCSESCRKQDNDKQLPQLGDYSPPLDSLASLSFEEFRFPDIVAPRSPTAPSKRSSCTFSEVTSDDDATSGDEHLSASRYSRHSRSRSRPAHEPAETTVRPPLRPQYSRASTSFSAAPSLSHTPASSISYSLPYTPATRPLPPRSNPHNSSYSSYAGRYTDLVTPYTYATTYATAPSSPHQYQYSLKSAPLSTTDRGNIQGEILMYEKSPIPDVLSANGSLKQLFAATPQRSAS